jgi:hypothetical protein
MCEMYMRPLHLVYMYTYVVSILNVFLSRDILKLFIAVTKTYRCKQYALKQKACISLVFE